MPSRSAVAEMTRTEVLRHLRDVNADYRDCANETAMREMLVAVTALASVTSTSTTSSTAAAEDSLNPFDAAPDTKVSPPTISFMLRVPYKTADGC